MHQLGLNRPSQVHFRFLNHHTGDLNKVPGRQPAELLGSAVEGDVHQGVMSDDATQLNAAGRIGDQTPAHDLNVIACGELFSLTGNLRSLRVRVRQSAAAAVAGGEVGVVRAPAVNKMYSELLQFSRSPLFYSRHGSPSRGSCATVCWLPPGTVTPGGIPLILPLATASHQPPVVFTEGRMLRLSGLTDADKSDIRRLLTIPNPRRMKSLKYTGWVDAREPKELLGYADLPEDEILVAPGAGWAVWHHFEAKGRKRFWQPILRPPITQDTKYEGESRSYQEDVVVSMSVRTNAVAVGPCGCGKTDMALRVMAVRGGPWLIVVHMRKLRTQWAERIATRMGAKVSLYSTTRKKKWDPEADFVIATVQALRRNGADVAALAAENRGVWVDECHHTPCATFTDVLALGAWRYRYGVTATPTRNDGTTALMHWWIGPVVATVDRGQVEDSGHLLRPTLQVITSRYTDTYNPDEPGDSQRLIGRLCGDEQRLRLVADAVCGLWHHGRHILVCVDRIAYGEELALILTRDYKIPVECCNARLPKAEQDRIMSEVANGEIRVVIATSLADEGLDLPILDTVVLATPSGSATRTEQRMGRACRPLAGKVTPVVVDIVDPMVSRVDESGTVHRVFLNQFRRRYNAVYRKQCNCDYEAVRLILKGRQYNDSTARNPGT